MDRINGKKILCRNRFFLTNNRLFETVLLSFEQEINLVDPVN